MPEPEIPNKIDPVKPIAKLPTTIDFLLTLLVIFNYGRKTGRIKASI